MDPAKSKPAKNYFKLQGRYRGVNEDLLQLAKEDIEAEWAWIKRFME